MRLVSILLDGTRRAGVVKDDQVLVTDIPGVDSAIAHGIDLETTKGQLLPLSEVQYDAPLHPPVVLCTGQNYRDHLAEKAPVEVKEPEFFLKAGQTIAAPGEDCRYDPAVTKKLDYETELGVVIGRVGRSIPHERALEHIFGYVVFNDLTARDRQVKPIDDDRYEMALGASKNFDGATRLGAMVVTRDEVGDPQGLSLTTRVNGELRQSNTTANMVFSVAEIIAFFSRVLTLQPGMVIATGTPGGTGWGQDPELGGTGVTPAGCVSGRYLLPGDRVDSEIDRLGILSFEVLG